MDRIVVFDLAGVICDFFHERRLEALADATGLPADRVDELVFRSGLDARAEAGEFTAEQYADVLNDKLDVTLAVEDYRKAWAAALSINEELLRLVRYTPKPTAVFTNSGPFLSLAFDHELSAVADAVDNVVVSWQTGSNQPDRVAFEGLGAMLQAAASELILVDANKDNVNGARDAGIDAIRFKDAEHLRHELRLRHVIVNMVHH